MSLTYKRAGVNVTLADTFIGMVTPLIKSTHKYWNGEIMNDVGGFAAVLKTLGVVTGVSTDGVGTKAWLAGAFNQLETIGEDLVAMNANDLWVSMEPETACFVDYYATRELYIQDGVKIIQGIVQGCKLASTALVGGETAEMPLMSAQHPFELAGTIVGVASSEQAVMRPHWSMRPGMGIFGYPSSGAHSNGYSLIHRAFGIDYSNPRGVLQKLHTHYEELGCMLGEALIKQTRIYQEKISRTRKAYNVAGFAHITGGGLNRNIPRILPPNCDAVVRLGTWPRQPIFDLIAAVGDVPQDEMLRTLNCGIGLVAISKDDLTPAGYYYMGDVVQGERKISFVK